MPALDAALAWAARCPGSSHGTLGQRLVRAKAEIKQAGIALRLPDHEHLAERLDTVLEAI